MRETGVIFKDFKKMNIVDLYKDDAKYINQLAELLFSEFRINWPNAWPTLESAKKEINGCLSENNIFRVAIDSNQVIGCVGGQPQYGGKVWEVHPIVVRNNYKKQGIGKLLLKDIETRAKRKNGITLFLGSDDENGMTSVANIDLYPNPLRKLLEIKNIKNHPFEFYIKCGFSIVGIIPDANGHGKPDILLAKKIE